MTRPSNILIFPRHARACSIIVTDEAYDLLLEVVEPFHGVNVAALLKRAELATGGWRISGSHVDAIDLMEAVGVEARGFLKVEEENVGRPLRKPKPGGTAARLFAIYKKLEDQLS